MSTTAFGSASSERAYIIKTAQQLGLDPEAVLAVAAHEGVTLPSEVGDSGTSFGPWQLHEGGALPQQIFDQGAAFAEQWANSPAGINYALQAMAKVAGGRTGNDAVTAIVTAFERPADPGSEVANSETTYAQGGGPSALSFSQAAQIPGAHGSSFMGQTAGLAGGLVNTGLGALTLIPGVNASELGLPNSQSAQGAALNAANKALGNPFGFFTSWRFAEVVGGVLLVLVGLVLLGRALGLGTPGLPGGADRELANAFESGRQQGERANARAAGRASVPRTARSRESEGSRARGRRESARARTRAQAARIPDSDIPF